MVFSENGLFNSSCNLSVFKKCFNVGLLVTFALGFGLSSQIERDLISQRTKCSLDAKKAAGVKLGRPLGSESRKLKLSKNTKRIRDLLDKKMPKAQIARVMGVQKITLRRFIKRMGWNY